jgi:YidC/Oxa1 family membrane protein insertase
MGVWSIWIEALRQLLEALSSDLGLGLGVAIIAATVLVRSALLPISWNVALRSAVRQRKLRKLQPELERAKRRFGDDRRAYAERMLELYREHGVSAVDAKGFLGALAQMPVLIGMYQTLRGIGEGVRFLWVANLRAPDAGLALVAALATALMMIANPDLPEHVRVLMIVVPSLLALVTAMHFGSALALYWTTSNCFSAVQALALRKVVARRIARGKLEA